MIITPDIESLEDQVVYIVCLTSLTSSNASKHQVIEKDEDSYGFRSLDFK